MDDADSRLEARLELPCDPDLRGDFRGGDPESGYKILHTLVAKLQPDIQSEAIRRATGFPRVPMP